MDTSAREERSLLLSTDHDVMADGSSVQ